MINRSPNEPDHACPRSDDLVAFTLGKMELTEIEEISHHLVDCDSCVSRLKQLDHLSDSLIRDLRGDSSDPADTDRVEELTNKILSQGATLFGDKMNDGPVELGQYLMFDLIGRGAMSEVYRAYHRRLQRPVVVKVLSSERTVNPESVKSFRLEMATIGRLNHPNIIQATDADEVDGCHYLVMEYADGADLSTLLAKSGPLAAADACEIICQTARGLQAAHDAGVVHRDLKPSNLLLTKTGEVKILDLGLACFAAQQELSEGDRVVGTTDYMAPEQWRGAATIDGRADIYSLGCTFYKLLSGHAPFHTPPDGYTRRTAHLSAKPPAIPDLPSPVANVLSKMLAKDAEDRFAEPHEIELLLAPLAKKHRLSAFAKRTITIAEQAADRTYDMPTITRWEPSPGRRFWRLGAVIGLAVVALLTYAAFLIPSLGLFSEETVYRPQQLLPPSVPAASRVLEAPEDNPLKSLQDLHSRIVDVEETPVHASWSTGDYIGRGSTADCTYESIGGQRVYRISGDPKALMGLGGTSSTTFRLTTYLTMGEKSMAGVFWRLHRPNSKELMHEGVRLYFLRNELNQLRLRVAWNECSALKGKAIGTSQVTGTEVAAPKLSGPFKLEVNVSLGAVAVKIDERKSLIFYRRGPNPKPFAPNRTTALGIFGDGETSTFSGFSFLDLENLPTYSRLN